MVNFRLIMSESHNIWSVNIGFTYLSCLSFIFSHFTKLITIFYFLPHYMIKVFNEIVIEFLPITIQSNISWNLNRDSTFNNYKEFISKVPKTKYSVFILELLKLQSSKAFIQCFFVTLIFQISKKLIILEKSL